MKLRIITLLIIIMVFSGCQTDPDEGRYSSIAEGRVLNVPAMTGGKIMKLNVDTGNLVEKNQILGTIDTTELHLQRNLVQAQFNELEIQSTLARNSVEQAQTQHNYISEKQQRISQLYAKKSTSRQSLDDANNSLKQAAFALDQAKQNFQTVYARRAQLQAQLDLLDKKISDAVICAPSAGIISERFYESGEAIPTMASLVEIINLQEIEVKIYINELQLPHIKTSQKVTIHIDGNVPVMPGTVSWISPKAEFTPKSVLTAENRTSLVYAVKILVKNSDRIIKHGMPLTVEL